MNHFLTWLAAAMAVAGLAFGLAIHFVKRSRARRETRRGTQREALATAARAQAERDHAVRVAALQTARDRAARAEAERVRRADAAQAAQAAREQALQTERRAAEEARVAEFDREREQAERARQREEAQRELAAAESARAAEAAQEHSVRRAAEEEAASRAAHEAALRRAAQAAEARDRHRQALAEEAARVDVLAKAGAPAKTREQTLIMIADDSKVVRIKAGRLLTQHRFRVAYASDGLEAAREVRKILPDVVITDVEMPGMDGFELTRQVRADARTAHIPVIMITAADDKHRGEAERAGVSALLGKPYAEEALIEQIQLALGHTLRTVVPG